jgi:peptidoglycan-associated lipoprotein
MRANPKYIILIEGHADARGTTEYNLALGERRAGAAKNYLLGQGVPASRVTIVSYGKERPSCHERNETCWGENRRAHFLVTTQSAETAR